MQIAQFKSYGIDLFNSKTEWPRPKCTQNGIYKQRQRRINNLISIERPTKDKKGVICPEE